MDAGGVLAMGKPADLAKARGCNSLEDAFISYLEEANAAHGDKTAQPLGAVLAAPTKAVAPRRPASTSLFSPRRLFAYAIRESLEMLRDPIRLGFALLGTAFLR
jgi:ribosome-dependent ATPase